ncbi:peptidogalycan biosysnthesis protein [Roseateles koreensis]|uniref:Peptidogalycan biosysnthesis protein n=1 Tax=Roseateles koreensis TaxID=2987526 RepID=A0ABT5KVC4_9BURK|nr:peptidogalycan biosysnthesis protein [Roseateles koreensis]MDC8786323.1 peptidogalycan biosysnthesis protein [Roseateles koreensis]
MKTRLPDYVIRVHGDPSELPVPAWNELLSIQSQPTPFMRLDYLQALTNSLSATAATGWQPQFLSVWLDDTLVAACPAYLKSHSYGEYVALCRNQQLAD